MNLRQGSFCSLFQLFENQNIPALFVSTGTHESLFITSAFPERYIEPILAGKQVCFDASHHPQDPDPQARFDIVPDQDRVTFQRSIDGHGEFRYYLTSPDVAAIVHEPATAGPSPVTPQAADQLGLDSSETAPLFHFTYIQNLLTGARTYSNISFFETYSLARTPDGVAPEWRALIAREDQEMYDNMIATATRQGGEHELRYRLRALDGSILHVRDLCGVTRGDGKWPTLIGSVSSEEPFHAKIRQAQQQALIGQLASGIVHDFRNLLTGIQNTLEWCGSQMRSDDPIRQALSKTVSYTGQATDLINGLLALRKGKNKEEPAEQINVEDVINELAPLIRHVLTPAVNLEIEIEPDLPPIYGQRSALRDILVNLCSNARDALGEKGGDVWIQCASRVEASRSGTSRNYVVLKVRDNGDGIPQEKLNSVFNLFYSTKSTGAGLGLWMVREATRGFDGEARVSSDPGQGATFELLFPAMSEFHASAPTRRDELDNAEESSAPVYGDNYFSGHTPKTVLLIEDEPLIRSSIVNWLESLGCEVLSAGDGLKGLELFHLHHKKIDIIVQDYILPNCGGVELLNEFATARPDIPVILCSGLPERRDEAERGKSASAYAFLPKPFKIEKLLQLMREALNA